MTDAPAFLTFHHSGKGLSSCASKTRARERALAQASASCGDPVRLRSILPHQTGNVGGERRDGGCPLSTRREEREQVGVWGRSAERRSPGSSGSWASAERRPKSAGRRQGVQGEWQATTLRAGGCKGECGTTPLPERVREKGMSPWRRAAALGLGRLVPANAQLAHRPYGPECELLSE